MPTVQYQCSTACCHPARAHVRMNIVGYPRHTVGSSKISAAAGSLPLTTAVCASPTLCLCAAIIHTSSRCTICHTAFSDHGLWSRPAMATALLSSKPWVRSDLTQPEACRQAALRATSHLAVSDSKNAPFLNPAATGQGCQQGCQQLLLYMPVPTGSLHHPVQEVAARAHVSTGNNRRKQPPYTLCDGISMPQRKWITRQAVTKTKPRQMPHQQARPSHRFPSAVCPVLPVMPPMHPVLGGPLQGTRAVPA